MTVGHVHNLEEDMLTLSIPSVCVCVLPEDMKGTPLPASSSSSYTSSSPSPSPGQRGALSPRQHPTGLVHNTY